MKDVSFVIGLKIDSNDRLDNLKISIDNLKYNFPQSEIIIAELDSTSKIKTKFTDIKHIFVETTDFFNRQRAINYGISASKRKIVVHYDADIILNKKIAEKCVNLILNEGMDIMYPHNGYFYDIPKNFHKIIEDEKNLNNIHEKNCILLSTQNVGGAVFFSREKYWAGGGANENFLGLGYEDNEIFERFKKLKFKIGRINAPIFHLHHERKETSYDYNPYVEHNKKEYINILKMNFRELSEHIKTWNYEKQTLY